MKAITLLFFTLIAANVFAQSEKINHIEIGANALFWTPTAEHLRATNTLIRAHSETTYINPTPNLQGYGSCIAPSFHINYYFKNSLGISLGFDYLSLTNHLEYEDTYNPAGSTVYFHNEAQIFNIKLGYSGQSRAQSLIHIYYGLGLNFTPSYTLDLNTTQNFLEQAHYSAHDIAFGLYVNSGLQIKLFKFTYLNLGMEYTYIPKTIHYKAKYEHEVKTNLGGIAGQIGIAVKFLNY